MYEAIGDLTGPSLGLLLLESVDQFDGREEPNPLMMMLDGLNADRRGDMRFTSAGSANQNDVVSLAEEVAAMKLAHELFVDLAAVRSR